MDLYIDIVKGVHTLNTGKLTRKRVMVRGQNGKVFYRMQWVNPWDASTGHGVRAIHNEKHLDTAMKQGLNNHPNYHQALSQQGIHSTKDLKDKLHFDHPVFLPETEESAGHGRFLDNHIKHGHDRYLAMFDDNTMYHHLREMNKLDNVNSVNEAERMGELSSNLHSNFLQTLDEGSTMDIGWSVMGMTEGEMNDAKELTKLTYGEDSPQYDAIKDMEPDPDKMKPKEEPKAKIEHVIEPREEDKPQFGTPEGYDPDGLSMDDKIRNMGEWRREATEKELAGKKKKEAITNSIDFDELERMDDTSVADRLNSKQLYGDLHASHERALDHRRPSPLASAWSSAKDIFGDLSTKAIEHVFSSPTGKYSAEMAYLKPETEHLGGGEYDHTWKMRLNFKTPDGFHAGYVMRNISKGMFGGLNIYNDFMEIDEEHQGLGIATDVYDRSEQLWKHMSKGDKVSINMLADISIGAYAWASKDKGFDFADEYELNSARRELRDFISTNGWDEHEVMSECGYDSVDDLEHAWEFAELDDGYRYDLSPHDFEDAKGSSHLGKAFMLTSKSSWEAMKHINEGGEVNLARIKDSIVDDYLSDTGRESYDYDDDILGDFDEDDDALELLLDDDDDDLDDPSDEELEQYSRLMNKE